MIQVKYIMDDWCIGRPRVVPLIYEGENEVAEIYVKCDPGSDCSYELHRIIDGVRSYTLMDSREDGLHLTLTSKFLATDGEVTMQIRAVYPDGRRKVSNKFYLRVLDFIDAVDGLPEEEKTKVQKLIERVTALEASKQDKLQFDSMPTEDSDNPVTSDGVYSAIASAVSTLQKTGANILYGTTANWNSRKTLTGEKNYFYIYDDSASGGSVRAKVGDGKAYLIDIPFLDDYTLEKLENHIKDTAAHITEEERQFWNNKVTINEDGMTVHDATLIFTKK